RHLHRPGVPRWAAWDVHSLRPGRVRPAGRAAAHGFLFLGGDAARRGSPLPAGDRLAPSGADGNSAMTAWEIVVGIETHAQLLTRRKMSSGPPPASGAPANPQAAGVAVALPGPLPVATRAAVEHAIRFGLAVKGEINRRSIFARKNYFYPDLPKGYQISQ